MKIALEMVQDHQNDGNVQHQDPDEKEKENNSLETSI